MRDLQRDVRKPRRGEAALRPAAGPGVAKSVDDPVFDLRLAFGVGRDGAAMAAAFGRVARFCLQGLASRAVGHVTGNPHPVRWADCVVGSAMKYEGARRLCA